MKDTNIKVVHCIKNLDKSSGGPSRSLPTLCASLQRKNVKIDVVAYNSKEPNIELLQQNEVTVDLVKPQQNIFDKLFCFNYIQQINNDVNLVHLHNLWTLELHNVAKYCREKKIPYIWSPRGTLEPWSLSQKKYKKKIALFLYQKFDLNRATCIHATAKMEAIHLRALGFTNPIAVIPNSIEVDNYPLKKWNNLPNRKKTLLFLSRIHPKKGLLILFEAWKLLPETIRMHWELVIAGEGNSEYSLNGLKSLIKSKYCNLGIKVVGPQYGVDKIKTYHSADIFILPTYSENFGMVIAEAMCCGVPVITTRGTPWEILEKENIGWWVEASISSLISTMQKALSLSTEELKQKGIRSRNIIMQEYSSSVISSKYKELYEWVLFINNKTPDFIYK